MGGYEGDVRSWNLRFLEEKLMSDDSSALVEDVPEEAKGFEVGKSRTFAGQHT